MKRIVVLFVAVVLCLACFSSMSYGADKVIKLEFSNYLVAGDSITLIFDNFCQDIEKRTNGRVKITHHIAGTLTPPPQTFDSVISGIADIGAGATIIREGFR
jgi:TRAP-type transport system periplasmic protein